VTIPQSLAVDGAVVLDLAQRTATVIPAEPGHPAMIWRHGIEKLQRSGYHAPTVWAHAPGRRQIACGVPEAGALRFQFRKGDPAWPELIGTPRLAATVVVDRSTNEIMHVSFRGKRG
jgi:hypothetical protein